MIARLWHGVTPESKSAEYLEFVKETGLKDYRKTPGNRGVLILRRISDGRAHFTLISLWESFEAIRRFAGPDIEKAVYYPEDEAYLLELEPNVTHYEVFLYGLGGQ